MNKKQQPFFNPELSGFCSQMAMILHSGISPLEGITIMLEDSTSDREKDILQQILDTLQETADFSLSLKETSLFPSYLVHMVQIGEETGTLDEVMSALSEHYEREDSIAKSIRNAVTYPMIMIGMMLVVILVLLVKVMPYTMVKDNRTNKEVANAGSVLDGNIDPFINAYLTWISTGKTEE